MHFFSAITALAVFSAYAAIAIPINGTITFNNTIPSNGTLPTTPATDVTATQGCDSIGCFDSTHFSVIFNWDAFNILLNGAGHSQQTQELICDDEKDGFDSWLPFVFESKWSATWYTVCPHQVSDLSVFYSSITTKVSDDNRCSSTGNGARCIFPINP